MTIHELAIAAWPLAYASFGKTLVTVEKDGPNQITVVPTVYEPGLSEKVAERAYEMAAAMVREGMKQPQPKRSVFS